MNPFLQYQMLQGGGSSLTAQLLNRTNGTAIGNMTAGGNLSAAFDGVNSKINTACASLVSATPGYVGKTIGGGTAYALHHLVFYGSSDVGLTASGAVNVTLRAYGKNGVPANATDGTLLANLSVLNPGNATPVTVNSTDTATTYTNIWGYDDSPSNEFIGQLEIWVMA